MFELRKQRRFWWVLFLFACLGHVSLRAQVIISEFQAANVKTLRDDDGNFEDWIELCNVSSAPVNLAGWYLSDDGGQLKKWQFPSTNLAAGKFLIVFASNKDHRNPGQALHTNFKLSTGGEFLGLVKPDGITVVSAYAPAFPPQADDISFGVPVRSQTTTLLAPGVPGKFLVPSSDVLGTNWILPSFDDSSWGQLRTGAGFDLNNSIVFVPVADSVADWSSQGTQGSFGWFYGYYNKSGDGVAGYQTNDFVAFPRSDAAYGPFNYWTGTQFRWPTNTSPWDTIGQTDAYPTGINDGAEHWVIRRWRSTGSGVMQARWRIYKTNPTGSGVSGALFLNGNMIDSASVGGGDVAGLTREVMLGQVRPGDLIDLALTPIGPGSETDDAGDAAATILTISSLNYMSSLVSTDVASLMCGSNATAYLRVPFTVEDPSKLEALKLKIQYNDGFLAFINGVPVATKNAPVETTGGTQADSVADWSSSGQQGYQNWYYGYYDKSGDANGTYDAITDFTSATSAWSWNGGAWVLGPTDPPWDSISLGGWQPNGTNSGGVHWPIRRWISDTAGLATCAIAFAKENISCGNGATIRVFQNSSARLAWTLRFDDATGLHTNLLLNLEPGDLVDFALDPAGPDGAPDDSCDGCAFSVSITQSPSEGALWNSSATAARTPQESSLAEEIDISGNRAALQAGTNILAIQALNCSVNDRDFLIVPQILGVSQLMSTGVTAYFTAPTPGSANGAGSMTIGPLISDVQHTPTVPGNDDELWVLARVSPTLRPVRTVTLVYRVMFGLEVSTAMYDDGIHHDGAAGDGLFGAVIPAAASIPGQMVRYCIVASDMNSQASRAPTFWSPTRSPQYFGTVVWDTTLTNSRLPVLHWFMPNPALADSDTTARCAVFFNGDFYDNVGVDLHGQSTRGFPKKSYDFQFNPGWKFRWSENAPKVDDINLLTTWADKAHVRHVLAHETYRNAGSPSHFAFPVRVQQNRSFYSVANIVESGNEDFLERLGLDPQGALYKMYNSAESVSGAEKKTRKFEGTADLQALITGMSQANLTSRQIFMFDNLDVPEVVDFLAAKIITADVDCCFKNYYFYRDSDGTGEWQAMPWDVDLSFGRIWTCGTPCYSYFDETIYTNQGITVGNGNIVFTPVYGTAATRQMFLRRLRTLMDEMLQPPGTPATNDFYRNKTLALRDLIAPDAALDLNKWGTWGTRETITQAVNRIWNEFLPGRRGFLFGQMSVTNGGEIPASQATNAVVKISGFEYRPTSGNPLQEWLSLTNPNSYAVDISSWRLEEGLRFTFKPGTVIPARGTAYVSPNVKAFRSRSVSPKGGEQRLVLGPYDGDLSARGESVTLVDPLGRIVSSNSYIGTPSLAQQYLRITELFYNPSSLAANTNLDPQLFEFIELRNIGPVALDLRGVKFTEGVAFDFSAAQITNLPAGGRVLVVADTNAFTLRYGTTPPVAGQFVGNLSNGGERLRLVDSYGENILDFSYDNKWYPITDGHGFSLVILDDTMAWSLWGEKTSWRPNGQLNGTPGQPDTSLPMFAGIVINEVLAHTDPPQVDAIELYNSAGTNVDIGSWYLSDSFTIPKKFKIPSPTVIPPHSCVYFTEAQFNPVPGKFPSFGLNSEGDDVCLFSSDSNSNLTGYVERVDFGATANGVSIGRFTNSVGEVDFPLQSALTLGRTNAPPLVGPVVISEIMYHPASALASNLPASYIELANVATTNTPLFTPTEATNTWKLRNAVDFDFPTNVSLPAGARVLVVGFDPKTNSALVAQFKSLYSVPVATPIYGPWSGHLGNADQTLELKKPDLWGTNGVPYVMVEKVHYLDHAPWPPEADGSGFSLQRRSLVAYANEPTNWFASTPTSGSPNFSNTPPTVQLISPVEASVFQVSTTISFSASASDPDGTVERVEFRVDGAAIGTVLLEPYSITWTNPSAGNHTVTAVAIDERFGATESAPVRFTVLAPAPTVVLLQPTDPTLALAGSNVVVSAAASSAGAGIDYVEFRSGGQAFARMYAPPYQAGLFSAAPGVCRLTAVAVDTLGSAATSAVVRVAFSTGTDSPVQVVQPGSTWKYLDDGSDQGAGWASLGFDDSFWKSGRAELGYGDASDGRPEITEISYGPTATSKWVTYYFRQSFNVANAANLKQATIRLLRDDGAVVYLNGQEVFRSNMPEGPLNYLTFATNAVAGAEETTWFQKQIDGLILRNGTNAVAVEVHQSSRDSSDLSFDFALNGITTVVTPIVIADPVDLALPVGGTAVFSAQVLGSVPLSCQWLLDQQVIPNATSTTLVLTNIQSVQAGSYRLLVTNMAGSTLSSAARLSVTNAPPIAGPDGLLVPYGGSASLSSSTVLINDRDPAGQPLSFSGFNSSSQAGATITRSGNELTYRAISGFEGEDLFTYTVTATSGLSAEGRVYVLVYRGSLPSRNSLAIAPAGGGYLLRYLGTPGASCQLQRSADLANWSTISSAVIPAHGLMEYKEGNPLSQAAYYRARTQ